MSFPNVCINVAQLTSYGYTHVDVIRFFLISFFPNTCFFFFLKVDILELALGCCLKLGGVLHGIHWKCY